MNSRCIVCTFVHSRLLWKRPCRSVLALSPSRRRILRVSDSIPQLCLGSVVSAEQVYPPGARVLGTIRL